jgi:hypothetical protein
VKKHSSFKLILFCSVGHLAYILYHILYLGNKLTGKIQVKIDGKEESQLDATITIY